MSTRVSGDRLDGGRAVRGSPWINPVLVALFVAAFAVNYWILPDDQVVSSLYAVPVLVAAHFCSPRAIALNGAAAVAIYLFNSFLERRSLVVWPFGVGALAAVAYLAVQFAVQKARAAQRAAEAAEAHAQLQQFLGLVGHDLAGTLTGLVGYAGLLVEGDDRVDPEEAHSAIDGASRRMRRLIDDLRDASTIGTGHFRIAPAPMDLAEVIDRLVTEHQSTAPRHHLVIEELAVVKGTWDEERLGQLFANLLSNAVNYSPPGGRIRVRVAREGDSALVAISDEGSGIPREEQDALFRQYFRAGTADGIKGMGLGLYIAKAIVEAHGGQIWVDSAVGEGTTFSVRLPIDEAH